MAAAYRPDEISTGQMKRLAEHIEEYLDLFEHIMVVPPELIKERRNVIDPSIKTVRQLIKKLKNGDKGVFRDIDDDDDLPFK